MSRFRLPLTFALPSYDHVRAVTSGQVEIGGVEPRFVDLPTPGSFSRFVDREDWDITDVSLGEYVARRAAGDDRVVALPIFTSRMFRHRCIYVRKDQIHSPEDLRGASVGVVDWNSTSGVYARGLLSDLYGVGVTDVHWVHAGMGHSTDETGALKALSDGVEIAIESERTLPDMLRSGDVAAVVVPTSSPSLRSLTESDGLVGQLFESGSGAEKDYYAKTQVFPILRLLGVRRERLERHRWLASNIYRAFEVARRRYFARLEDIAASRVPIPWIAGYLADLREVFGPDLWPYGVDANRPTFEAFVRYSAEQGVIDPGRGLDAEDLFAPVEPFVDGM